MRSFSAVPAPWRVFSIAAEEVRRDSTTVVDGFGFVVDWWCFDASSKSANMSSSSLSLLLDVEMPSVIMGSNGVLPSSSLSESMTGFAKYVVDLSGFDDGCC